MEKNTIANDNTTMLSGGELSVESVNVVKNEGNRVDLTKNASISTFNNNILVNFLKYPTLLYEGSISTSAPIGTDLYVSEVSPAILKTTSLTRISNFATNFRQWSGSMMLRMIFTKPIFIQTKIIIAFLPGTTIAESTSLSVNDLYGAQYHAVMNPDNDNELSFTIPFISGLNWLNMNQSSGVVSIKLFQPLIASQPTGVAIASIPFTILLSSENTTQSALNFRFLVAPTFDNHNINSQAIDALISSITPNVENTNRVNSLIPPTINNVNNAKTLILIPKIYISIFKKQMFGMDGTSSNPLPLNTFDISENVSYSSFDASKNGQLTIKSATYPLPYTESMIYLGVDATKTVVVNTYAAITPTLNLQVGQYSIATDVPPLAAVATNCRFIYCSNILNSPLGSFVVPNFSLTIYDSTTPVRNIMTECTLTVSINSANTYYNYLIQCKVNSYTSMPGIDAVGFSELGALTYHSATTNSLTVVEDFKALYSKVINEIDDPTYTHFAVYSNSTIAEITNDLSTNNYSNCVISSAVDLAAGFNERAKKLHDTLSSDAAAQQSILSFLMAFKYGVDIVASASRILSNVLSYVIPAFSYNGVQAADNHVIFDLTSTSLLTYGKQEPGLNLTNSNIINPDIHVI